MKTVKTMESSMPLKRRRLLCGLLCLTLLFTLPSACAAAYRIEYSNLYVSPHDPEIYFCEFGYSLDGGEIRVEAEGEQLQMTDN